MSNILSYWQYVTNNKEKIIKSKCVYCIYCKKKYDAKFIKKYTDNNSTAMCCYCNVDSVVGDAETINVTSQLLNKWHNEGFSN